MYVYHIDRYCLCSFLMLSFTEVREVILKVGHSQEWCPTRPASGTQGQSGVATAAYQEARCPRTGQAGRNGERRTQGILHLPG